MGVKCIGLFGAIYFEVLEYGVDLASLVFGKAPRQCWLGKVAPNTPQCSLCQRRMGTNPTWKSVRNNLESLKHQSPQGNPAHTTRDTYLVYPKNGSFNCQIPAFSIVNASFDDFMKTGIDHIMKPAKLNYIFAGVGRPWILDYKDKMFSLALDSTDARSALTSFCDAIGPHIVWHVLGCDPDWVNVGFSPVYPQK